jgi:hypothetical protein
VAESERGLTPERTHSGPGSGAGIPVPHISNCVVPGQRVNASVPSDRKGCQEEPEREQKVAEIFSIGSVLFYRYGATAILRSRSLM